jgi:hypothetical protein
LKLFILINFCFCAISSAFYGEHSSLTVTGNLNILQKIKYSVLKKVQSDRACTKNLHHVVLQIHQIFEGALGMSEGPILSDIFPKKTSTNFSPHGPSFIYKKNSITKEKNDVFQPGKVQHGLGLVQYCT